MNTNEIMSSLAEYMRIADETAATLEQLPPVINVFACADLSKNKGV